MLPFAVPAAMAVGGAIAGGLSAKMANKGKYKQLPTGTPGQQQSSDWMRQQGQRQIENPYEGFEPIRKQSEEMFQKRTIPSIATRFMSMGNNSIGSPALYSHLREGANDLHSNLDALMAQYGQREKALGQNLMGMGMQPQFENVYEAGSPSFLSGALGGLSSGLMQGAGAGFKNDLFKKFGNYSDTINTPGVGGDDWLSQLFGGKSAQPNNNNSSNYNPYANNPYNVFKINAPWMNNGRGF